MAKRKAGVNDIIYELDNSDIELSSDDEGKESKIRRFIPENARRSIKTKVENVSRNHEVVNLDSPENITTTKLQCKNGGKTESGTTLMKNNPNEKKQSNNFQISNFNIEKREGHSKHFSETILFDEDIDVDSPAANSDLSIVGCENRTPLVTVRFRDNQLAHIYKKQVKEFLLNLLKSQNTSNSSVDDTDIEFDIWPEDVDDDNYDNGETGDTTDDDNLFFMDTALCDNTQIEIPVYNKASCVISNSPKKEDSLPPAVRSKMTCFNCDGEHSLRECHLPRDNYRIAEKRKAMPKLGRYHVEDDQKYGHLVPGRISASLRNALGLKRYELPPHIYKMRLLGYPPGWLEEARISHSGIRLFGASGSAILDPEEEEGEVCEPGSKDKFDIKKILDFPGFNVPASSRYIDEAHLMGYPPMSEADSKMLMLQALAPNAVKAYKRKKLMFFPANNSSAADGQMEMELDSGDEIVEFPSVPPLPDEAPPPPLPPPPPPPEGTPPDTPKKPKSKEIIQIKSSSPKESKAKDLKDNNDDAIANKSNLDNDLEIIEVLQVPDIPVPEDGFITIDEDYDTISLNSSRNSPTLDDLEEKKRLLLSALKDGAESEVSIINISDTADTQDETTDIEEIETLLDIAEKEQKEKESKLNQEVVKDDDNKSANEECTDNENINKPDECEKETDVEEIINKDDNTDNKTNLIQNEQILENQNESDVKEESDTKTSSLKTGGKVKTTAYGTPVINVASPYLKLPSEDKFSKDICDVINFENLPNSTGTFKKISTLLKKVKTEVDRIHDS